MNYTWGLGNISMEPPPPMAPPPLPLYIYVTVTLFYAVIFVVGIVGMCCSSFILSLSLSLSVSLCSGAGLFSAKVDFAFFHYVYRHGFS